MAPYFYLPYTIRESFLNVFANAINSDQLETNIGLFLDKYVFLFFKETNIENASTSINSLLKYQIALIQALSNKKYGNHDNIDILSLLLNKSKDYDNIKNKLESGIRLSIPFKSIPKKHYDSFKARKLKLYNDLKSMGYYVESITAKSIWRALINFGSESVYETSLLFDRNYSIPFIPGSAVKGVTRHYAQYILQEANTPMFTEIFGDDNKKESGKGKVIFFDVYPIIENDRDFIVLDILNVHYQKYYTKRKEFGDWMQPTPIFFLAIEKGTKFNFVLAGKNQKLVDKAKEYLTNAIREIGIGAKTSSGYGYFEVAKS